MSTDHVQSHEDTAGDSPISLSHIARTFKRYAGVAVIATATVAITYVIVAAAFFLLAERERMSSLPFRLEFKGAERGEYPNGLKFSVADITAGPVLLDVFNANDLSRFVTFSQFSRSMYVLEANPELERLSREYAAKLADSRLSSVDRERIEREFQSKRDAISKSAYALQMIATKDVATIPGALVPKILDDTLRTWARRAAVEKKVLDYRVAALTPNILDDVRVENGQYLVPLLLLRRRIDDVIENLQQLLQIPGAELVRTRKGSKSLEEIRLTLDEIIRFRLEPLIANARAGGGLGSRAEALRVLRAQVSYDERALAAARGRELALRNALATYESNERTLGVTGTTTATGTTETARGETVMPQISDTFLDRIVDLANRNADRDFRQTLTGEIRDASLAIVPLEAAVKYDLELIEAFTSPQPETTSARLDLSRPWNSLVADVRTAIEQVNEIYATASSHLYPETELYRVTGPPVNRTIRTVSTASLAFGGVLTLLIAIPLITIGILLHNRLREEESLEHPVSHPHVA